MKPKPKTRPRPKDRLSKSAEIILRQHNVSSKQYLAWAVVRFRNQAFWWGIGIASIIVSVFLIMAYLAYQKDPTNMQDVWGLLAAALIFSVILAMPAFWSKSGGPTYLGDPAYTPRGFKMIGMMHVTSPKFLKKLSDRKWRSIQKFDVEKFEAKEKKKRPGPLSGISKAKIEHFIALKLKMKRVGLIGGILFSLLLVLFPFYLGPLVTDSSWRPALLVFLAIIYFAAIIGLNAWLFLYGLTGFLKREIILYGEFRWDDTIHYGKWAILFSIVAMAAAIISFALFMIPPIALLLGWS